MGQKQKAKIYTDTAIVFLPSLNISNNQQDTAFAGIPPISCQILSFFL